MSAFAPENLVWRDGFSNPVPRQPVHLHTQAVGNVECLKKNQNAPRPSEHPPVRSVVVRLIRFKPRGVLSAYPKTKTETKHDNRCRGEKGSSPIAR